MKKRKINIIILILLCSSVLLFFSMQKKQYQNIKVAYLYENETINDYYQYYEQSLLGNLSFYKIDIENNIPDLSGYDLVLPDSSLVASKNLQVLQKTFNEYVSNGGNLLLTYLTKDLLENSNYSYREITFPHDLKYPTCSKDYTTLQEIMRDYTDAFLLFEDYSDIKDYTSGFVVDNSDSENIVSTSDGAGVLVHNSIGKGNLYYLGAVLPTDIFTTGFDLQPKNAKKQYFNDTANASNHLLFTEIASIVSKDKLGFAAKRVFGSNGRPSISHQNHFEVLSAVKNGSMEKWIEMTEKNNQIASYSLAVGMYEWYNRYESIGYSLNYSNDSLDFSKDRINNFYAWGTHPVVNNKWLNINKSEENLSYFLDTELPTRAYPFVFDFNNDSVMDLVCGSSDGLFYVYTGLDFKNNWSLENSGYLKNKSGENLSVDGYSSPTFIDFDKDGIVDLISGSSDGNVYFFKGISDLKFEDKQILLPFVGADSKYKLSAPDVADIDNDGVLDIVCGYGNGDVYIYNGAKNYTYIILENIGTYAAPRIVDLNMDGILDIAVGTQSGYITKLIQNENTFYNDGFIKDGDFYNNKGNNNLKSGNNIVPFFVDLDKNGTLDLVCGLLEYGEFAVNITDPYFPYKKELENAIKFSKEHYVPIMPHFYSHAYKISEEEKASLVDQKKAFDMYGLDWENNGVNQHTWFTSSISPEQTLKNAYEMGLVWNFGYRPANSPALPADYSEYKMITPFYLKIKSDGENTKKSMLLYNANFRHEDEIFKTTEKYDLPVTVYRHSEYDTTRNPDLMLAHIKTVQDFKEKYNYNFVTETQNALAMASAYNTDVIIEYRPLVRFLNNLENKIRTLKK